jgi:hypothetical protein
MPDIINNVINSIPSSGHSIYVTELDDFRELQTKFRGGYRVSKTSASQSHMWDLYALGFKQLDRTSNINTINYYTKRFSTSKFFPLFCSNYSDDSGSNVYAQLPNFSKMAMLNHPKYSGYVYNANFSYSPLWCTTKRNAQSTGEYILYKASYKPLMPIMLCSSIPTHKTFGPAFLNRFTISVDGTNSLGDVEINCDIQGGRIIISPENIPIHKPYIDGSVINLATIDQSKSIFNLESPNNYSEKYRAYNLGDCAYAFGVFTGDNALERFAAAARNPYSDNRTAPVHKIVSMSLSISQELDFVFTYPGFSYADKLENFYDIVGPRFVSLAGRQVSGSIKLFCQTNYNFINTNASSLTMFFGSVYFYSMKNVDWQQPKVNVSPGGGYIIEYGFVARMGEEVYFDGLGNDRVSEFFVL